MTDQERASAFVGAQVEALDGFDVQQEINTLAEAFGAVRLDERRAIVAFLRDVATTMGEIGRPTTVALALLTMAEQIDAGGHTS